MKKVISFIAVFMLFTSMSTNNFVANNTLTKDTCFPIARDWVIQTEGEINVDNVGYVLELTAYLNATGSC